MITYLDVAAWLSSDEALPEGMEGATPSFDLPILERCFNAVKASVEANYALPEVWSADIEQAVILETAALYRRRLTPEGVFAVGEFGTVIAKAQMDPNAKRLLAPYFPYGVA